MSDLFGNHIVGFLMTLLRLMSNQALTYAMLLNMVKFSSGLLEEYSTLDDQIFSYLCVLFLSEKTL